MLRKQLALVYDSAFIDTAEGGDLDRVVALLAITRRRSGYASGSSADPRLHQTTLLMWSNYSDRAVDLGTIAAYDISPVMMELFGLRQPAYFQFLGRQLRAAYRANTRGTILEKDGTASNELTPLQQKWSDEHWLLQYDLMFGKGYALSRMGLEELSEGAD